MGATAPPEDSVSPAAGARVGPRAPRAGCQAEGGSAMRLHTPLCDLLGVEYPIIQAGMGWDKRGTTTPPELVAAVSNAGGLGMVGGSPLQPELIRERIRQIRDLTDRPFG